MVDMQKMRNRSEARGVAYEVPRMDLVRLPGADVVCASDPAPDNDVDFGGLVGPTGK